MKLVKYFLQKKSVTILLLILVLGGGLFSYIKMGNEAANFVLNNVPIQKYLPTEVRLRKSL